MRSHCRNGHEMTPANIYRRPTGYTDCKTCRDTEPSRYIFKGGLGLPEKVEYRDAGCNLRPACLSCDLARCQFDEPANEPYTNKAERWGYIWMLVKKGVPLRIIKSQLKVSDRTIQRARQAGGKYAGDDIAGKPVTKPRTIYKQRRPLPVMRENQHE